MSICSTPNRLRLIAAVPRHRANPDLNQPIRQPLLHDPGERTRVREAIAFELVVEIRMRVDLQDRERPVAGAQPAQDRIGDRMIAAERDERQPFLRPAREPRARSGCGRSAVAGSVRSPASSEHVGADRLHQPLGPRIAGRRAQRLTNDRRGAAPRRAGTRSLRRTACRSVSAGTVMTISAERRTPRRTRGRPNVSFSSAAPAGARRRSRTSAARPARPSCAIVIGTRPRSRLGL